MKRKVFGLLVLSAVLLAACSAAAQDDSDANETAAFATGLGANVRLLQLEAAIERNILAGREVVASIKAGNSSADTGELEGILGELQVLKDEVGSKTPKAGEEGARDFVDMKNDAIELSKEFREKSREIIKPGEVDGLRKKLKEIRKDFRGGLRDDINKTRLEYNADRLQEILSAANITNPGLVDDVRSGEAKLKDVREAVKDELKGMPKGERMQALFALREKLSKGNVFIRAVGDRISLNRLSRVQTRLENRLEKASQLNLTDAALERLGNRSDWVEARMAKVSEHLGKKLEHIGNITAKKVERLERLDDKLENRSEKLQERLEERLATGNLTEGQRGRIDARIERLGNRTQERQDRIEARQEKARGWGDRLQEKFKGEGDDE